MAWFLLGGHFSNGGPDNVNRALITSADGEILYIKSTNKFVRVLESFWKILISEGVVVSPIYLGAVPVFDTFMPVLDKLLAE